MSTSKPIANLTIDNPDADGRIEKHGIAYQWDFRRRRESEAERAPWQDDSFVGDWILDNCMIIEALDALALNGQAVKADMVLANWTVVSGSGYWREEGIAGKPAVDWLAYTDGRADQEGEIQSTADYKPRVCFWIKQFAPPPDQSDTYYESLEIMFVGDPGLGEDQVSYAIQFPLHSGIEGYKYPKLQRKVGSTAWEWVHEWRRPGALSRALQDTAKDAYIWVEEIDGLLLIAMFGVEEPWVYDAKDDDLRIQEGPIKVKFRGLTGMFNAQQIIYPEYAEGGSPALPTARPRGYLHMQTWMNRTNPSAYKYVEGNNSEGTVAVVNEAVPGQYNSRPEVTLTRDGTTGGTPVVYGVSQYVVPEWASPRSSPTETQQTPALAQLEELTWSRRWPRDWHFTAVLRDPDHSWLALCKAQCKVVVEIGWGTAADTQIMVAYLDKPAKEIEAGEIEERLVIRGRDYISARLMEKKYALFFVPPEGWQMREWATEALKRAGVPASMISIASETTPYVVPVTTRGESAFRISRDTPLVRMLDDVLKTHRNADTDVAEPWYLGIDSSGNITIGPAASYSAPADYTLDDTTQTKDDYIEYVQMAPGDDFRNYVALFAHDDPARLEGGIAMDEASHKTPADPNFCGEDLWHVGLEPGTPDDNERATEVLTYYMRPSGRLEWRTIMLPYQDGGHVHLQPESFVQVDIDNLGVPTESIFRITEDHGRIIPARREGVQTLYGVFEE